MKSKSPMEIEKITVDSEAIEAVGHDNTNRILRVWLKTKRVYDYFSVPVSRFNAFLQAESKGRYYNLVIKKLYKEYNELT